MPQISIDYASHINSTSFIMLFCELKSSKLTFLESAKLLFFVIENFSSSAAVRHSASLVGVRDTNLLFESREFVASKSF